MKKRIQKIISLFLALTMTASLTACDTLSPSGDNTEGTAGTTAEGHIRADYEVNAGTTKLDASSEISDILYGIFFEDINFSVDAGLYAELIKNRSFEYGSLASNAGRHGWVNSNNKVLDFKVVSGLADNSHLNANNTNYAILTNSNTDTALNSFEGIGNVGYLDGLAVTKDENYIVSLFAKGMNNYTGAIRVALEDSKGTVFAENTIESISDEWWKYEVTLKPNATVDKDLRLKVEINAGTVCFDMISMMPENTFKCLPIRKDIGDALEALNPSFIRFPGGCAVEGRDKASMYSWKDSIGDALRYKINGVLTTGDVSARPQGVDIWSGNSNNPYYTTYGIGFFEYFQLCDTLDALPVPILNAGMTCPIQSGNNYKVYDMESTEFLNCVQDALDLVEFCRGDETTYWGSVRIAMGQKEPFELKYIGIGNEQWQTEYHQHYKYFVNAFEQAAKENPKLYDGIELIVANGPVSTDKYGYNYVKKTPDNLTTLVDEHYYEPAEWFFANTKRYDSYDRTMQAAVFLGEYAAKANTMNAALAEAAFMTGLERNADIVKMACYAPLFGNSTLSQWTPDMIFFSNDSLMLTPNYYVQKLFANNVGVNILPSTLEVKENNSAKEYSGKIGLGSWMTSVSYDNLKIVDNDDNSVLYETDFSSDSVLKDDNWDAHTGNWSVKDGRLVQTNTASPVDGITGDVIYVGDTDWKNYTLTVNAKILSGDEGFLIPICVENKDNNIFWNLGGWGNTVSCLEIVDSGNKSGQVNGTVKNVNLKRNKDYEIKIVVKGNNIKCYLDNVLYINYEPATPDPLYETASIDANGDIIMKFVNPTEYIMDINISLKDIDLSKYNTSAIVTTLAADGLGAQNSFGAPDAIHPTEDTIPADDNFVYEAPSYSVTIIRIPHK